MTCQYCKANPDATREVISSEFEIITDAPRCAFVLEVFSTENWNCGAMNRLRDLAAEGAEYSEDQSCGVVGFDGKFVVLGWYKSRGRTELAGVVEGEHARPLTLTEATEAIEWRTK